MLFEVEGAGDGKVSAESDPLPQPGDAAARYEQLATDKYIYLQRARAVARVTIPYLFPPQGHSSATNYPTPFQSVGAAGINNLSSKLVLALFPPGEPFFKLQPSGKILRQMEAATAKQGNTEDMKAELTAQLSQVESDTVEEMESHGARMGQTEAVLQLLIAGNALLDVKDDNSITTHRLENYVTRRDVDGHTVEIITRQTLKRQSLPKEAIAFLRKIEHRAVVTIPGQTTNSSAVDRVTTFDSGSVDLFTIAYINRDEEMWEFHQEMMGFVIPDTDGTWPLDTPALIPLTWYRIQGEHYGRGFGEQYLGDLNSLEALMQAMIEYASIASQVKFVVDETGLTDIEEIGNTPNGGFLNGEIESGKPKNIAVIQVEKNADFQGALEVMNQLIQRLEQAFMKVQTRDAERVTAEEIRMLQKELQDTLGGPLAVLAQEMQRPLVRRVLLNMQKAGKIKKWPKGMIRPEVIAGLEGLGREATLQKLQTGFQLVSQILGPEGLLQSVNSGALITTIFAALGVDVSEIVKSAEQQAADAQAQHQQEMQKQMAPHMIKGAVDTAKSMREHPDSPVDSPAGVAKAQQAMQQATTQGAQGGPPQPPR